MFRRKEKIKLTGADLRNRVLSPLMIGVTGHIDLFEEHVPQLKQLVETSIRTFREKYPHTPVIMLSPLAAGADQLAAEVAIRMRDEGEPIQLFAQLPMPADEYVKNFPTEESVHRFRRLLELADRSYVVPAIPGIEQTHEQREVYYAAASDDMTKYSHVLIALWDGVPLPDATAGTAYTVSCMRDGIDSDLRVHDRLLDPVTGGIVIHIRTPRKKRPDIERPLTAEEPIYPTNFPQETGKDIFNRILANLDDFNRRLLKPPVTYEDKAPEEVPEPLGRLARMHTAADAIASHYQSRYSGQRTGLLVFAVLLLLFYELTNQVPLVLTGYVLCIASAYLFYRRGEKRQYKRLYLDYRALAEGLRVQYFWRLAGLFHDVSDYYLSQQRSEIEWICRVIRTEHFFLHTNKEGLRHIKHYQSVRNQWVKDQADYFAGSIRKKTRQERRSNAVSRWIFGTGATLMIAIMAGNLAIGLWEVKSELLSWLMVAAATIVAAGLAYESHNHLKAYKFYIAEHSRMKVIFDHSLFMLDRYLQSPSPSSEKIHRLLEKLGKEVLDENGAWVYVNRERQSELPKGL